MISYANDPNWNTPIMSRIDQKVTGEVKMLLINASDKLYKEAQRLAMNPTWQDRADALVDLAKRIQAVERSI